MTGEVALYSAVDDMLTHYEVDADTGTLTKGAALKLQSKVQYAWPHPTHKYLCISTSNGGPRVKSDYNHLSAFAVMHDGALSPHGDPKPLTRRAVHMCVDPSGRYALNAHNYPTSGITVHRIGPGGTVEAEVDQPGPLECGNYPHQVMVFPSGRSALIVDRGTTYADRPEAPGALRSFAFSNGILSPRQVVAPRGGYGFGPRHVAFHPFRPWMYVSDERTNRLYMFRFVDDQLETEPAHTRDTLANPDDVRPRQLAGPIHVHPSGSVVYVANRSDHAVEVAGKRVFGGGENNIAVYAIDSITGEPSLIQHADTRSFHVRTFACDPGGRLLVTASIKPHAVLEGDHVTSVPAALSVFRIREGGRLEYLRKYDVETTGNQLQYWMGMLRLE